MKLIEVDESVQERTDSPVSDTELANEFTKRLSSSLVGFRRKGRTWARSKDGVVTGIHVYRPRFSYDWFCWVRLEPFVRLEFGDVDFTPSFPTPEWMFFGGGTELRSVGVQTSTPRQVFTLQETAKSLDVAVSEACLAIARDIRPWLDENSTRDAFLRGVAKQGLTRRMETRLAFGQLPELADLLALGPPEYQDGAGLREFNLADAEVALRSYVAIGTPPSKACVISRSVPFVAFAADHLVRFERSTRLSVPPSRCYELRVSLVSNLSSLCPRTTRNERVSAIRT